MQEFLSSADPGQYPQLAAALLQSTLAARRITAAVALAHDGPQLWTFAAMLGLGEQPERIERMAGALALAVGAAECRVSRGAGKVLIEVPKPEAQRGILGAAKLDALKPPAPSAVVLGRSSTGAPVWLDLADDRSAHVVIGGTTGSGKSELLKWLLYRLLSQNSPELLKILVIDPKRDALRAFARVPHLLHEPVSHALDALRVLSWLTGELDQRMATGKTSPRVVVVIEEVADMIASSPEIGGMLARLAQVGRSCGLHAVAVTQQPGAKSLGDALQNFPARILGRVASSTLTYGAAGRARSMADQLLGRGDLILLRAGEVVRFQAPLCDAAMLATLPRASSPASLDAELPSVVAMADLARDRRGGSGRRDLSERDYERIEQDLGAGAGVPDLRESFGIGTTRARRIMETWEEVRR